MLKLDQQLENYILDHTDKEGDLLSKLYRETHVKLLFPRMVSGHLQGKILEMFSKMIKPKHILELGTYTGYSAICLAKGLQENGSLDSIEINDEIIEFAQSFIDQTNFKDKITIHQGNALDIIPKLNKTYEIVFIDADKKEYLSYYKSVIDLIPSGAYIIADNVLWNGKVVQEIAPNDIDTKAIVEFNTFVHNDPRIQNVLLPIRDGLMILRKN